MEGFGKRDSLPYYELFFNGGTSTVRGYKARHLGPKDSNYNLPLGGDFLWVNNVELRAPVYKKLVAAVFFDFGGLWEKPADFAGSDLRSSAGLGFRYLTPWGILRLDYGWRLHHESNEAPSHIHATFGIPF
jgi:outer membrane protein insertion porin family